MARKRTPDQYENDLVVVGEMTLQGYSQGAIAERLGVTQQEISHDLVKVRENWITQHLQTSEDSLISQELARLEWLISEYYKQWCASPDPRYGALINKTLEQRCKLLGLYRPEKYIQEGLDLKDIREAFNAALDVEDADIVKPNGKGE